MTLNSGYAAECERTSIPAHEAAQNFNYRNVPSVRRISERQSDRETEEEREKERREDRDADLYRFSINLRRVARLVKAPSD